jgi:hypothetical protein
MLYPLSMLEARLAKMATIGPSRHPSYRHPIYMVWSSMPKRYGGTVLCSSLLKGFPFSKPPHAYIHCDRHRMLYPNHKSLARFAKMVTIDLSRHSSYRHPIYMLWRSLLWCDGVVVQSILHFWGASRAPNPLMRIFIVINIECSIQITMFKSNCWHCLPNLPLVVMALSIMMIDIGYLIIS